MTLGAIVATQLTDQSARSYRLNIGGLDVLKPYGAAWSTRYGVLLETLHVNEEGPGGVSSMSFTLDDPRIEAQLALGSDVEFWDIARDRPLFRGFLQSVDIRVETTNRYIDITCIGIECLLDWILVPYVAIPAGTWVPSALQAIVYNMSGIGWPLRAVTQPSGSEDYGSQEYPIAGIAAGFPVTTYNLTLEGQTLRQAMTEVIAAADTWAGGAAGGYVSIDFYGALRYYNGNGGGSTGILTISPSSDMDTFGIDNDVPTAAGYVPTDGITFRMDSAGVTRAVYIVGGVARTTGVTPIGSGLVSDGSGIPGQVAYINDPTSTTDAIRDAIGRAYLGGFSQSTRATATFTPMDSALLDTYNYRAGSYIDVGADTELLAELTRFSIFAIRKTFPGGGEENWSVDFGGFAPSSVKQERRLTRDTRS